MTSHPLRMVLLLAAAWCAHAQAQPSKVDVSFSTSGVAHAHNVAPQGKNGGNDVQVSSTGDETIPCSNLPASKSSSSAYASGILVKKDDVSVAVQLNANALAKGGRFEKCSKCENQFCSQPSGNMNTEARARSEARANISYQFPASFLTKSLKSYRVVVSVLESDVDQSKLLFKVRRGNPLREKQVKPDEPFHFTPRPNEELVVEVSVKAEVRSSEDSDTKQDEPRVKLRVDITEAPVLEAAVQEGYILKGKLTTEYKSVGLIAMVNDQGVPKPHCTGTVIGASTVLTAAHCVSSSVVAGLVSARKLLFMVGSRLDDMVPIAVSEFFYPKGEQPDQFRFNEKFDKTLEDDIAVLKTEKPIGLPSMPLYGGTPPLDSLITAKSELTFVGFGIDPEGQTESGAGIKRTAAIAPARADNATFIYAAGEQGSNTCHGDSGGPAFIKNGNGLELAGITSYGSGDCKQGRSMRVDRYLNWIKSKIN